ncbi:MAG: acyl-CoA dehydrogenase family protein [Smithellaceae bacterium]
MDFKLTAQQISLKKEFEDFFKEEMKKAPSCYKGNSLESIYSTEEGFAFHRYMQKKLADKGWLTMAWPKEVGGREAPIIEQLIFNETLSYYGAPGIDPFGHSMFAPTLILFANEDQKKRLLVPIAKGEITYCQGWSEPNAGSDLASLKTTAIKNGDHYIVNGQKVWTTGGHRADRMFLLARTIPSEKKQKGLSVFSVDMKSPGIEIRPIHYMNGEHLYNETWFTDVKVPAADLVGPENDGWRVTRQTMNFERSGAGNFTGMKRTLEDLIAYVKTTKRGGKYLAEDPVVRMKLARLFIDIYRGSSLAYRVAWNQEKGKLVFSPAMASESKVFGSELRQRVGNFGTEIMGLHGQLESCEWAPVGGYLPNIYQECMGRNISGGTSEIQRNIIAWVGLGLPRFE